MTYAAIVDGMDEAEHTRFDKTLEGTVHGGAVRNQNVGGLMAAMMMPVEN